jgi:predicted transcriptional regulator
MPDGGYASKSDKYKRAWGINYIKEEHIIDATTIDYVPAYAENEIKGEEGKNYVVCAICGIRKKSLTQHLRREHNMTKEEYIKLYDKPVYSESAKESFHNCAVNKWNTQYSNGQYVKKEKSVINKRKEIKKEIIEQRFKEGFSVKEIANELQVTDVTICKYIKQYNLNTPSVTLLHIRRAVRNGATLNLELYSLEDLTKMIKEQGKEKTRELFGVKRNVFDTWISNLMSY